MRIRTIKPEWLSDERMCSAPLEARMLSVALILLADDYGRGRANEAWLAGQVFPFDPAAGRATVARGLAGLEGWFLRTYEVRGQRYFEVVNWSKHQRVDNAGKPHVPAPEGEFAEIRREPPRVADSLGVSPPDPDQDQDPEEDPDRREDPAEPRETATGLLISGYQKRYETRTNDIWQGHAAAMTHIAVVARWAERQAEHEGRPVAVVVEQWLESVFSRPGLAKAKWPWRKLSEDPARDYRAPAKAEEAGEDYSSRVRRIDEERQAWRDRTFGKAAS